MISIRATCFTLALISSSQVSATDKDITNPERLRTMGTLIQSVGYACIPVKVFDTGMIHGKQFYRIKCQDGQRYMIATPPKRKTNNVKMTDTAYFATDNVDWQKSEWINTIIQNTESLDDISKSHPHILE